MIELDNGTTIPESDLTFTFSRSSGPGGQNVNKVNSRVTLVFDLQACSALTEVQKSRIRRRLSTRIDKEGRLRIVCQKHRTQLANRRTAAERLTDLLNEALQTRQPRKKTRVPRAAIENRLRTKKQRSQLKQQRSATPPE